MASAKQIAANRRNAQKSSGPKTPEGKAISSQNRLVHGLLGRFRVLDGEDQQQYDQFVDQLIQDQKPVGLLETELVKKMSEHFWLSQRARRFQEGCFLQLSPVENNKAEIGVLADLERFTGYQSHHDCAFRRTLADLQKLRKERESKQIGFEREKRAQAEETRRAARELRAENEEFRRQAMHKIDSATRQIALQLKEQQFLVATAADGRQFHSPESAENQKIAA